MLRNPKITDRLTRYIEILPIPVAVFDEEFNLLDYNHIFEEKYSSTLEDKEFLKSLWDRKDAVKGVLMGEHKKFNILYLPKEVIRIKDVDDLVVQIEEYIETLKVVGALAEDFTFSKLFVPVKTSETPKKERKFSAIATKDIAAISVSNFIERSLIEGYLRRLNFKPIIRWGNETIIDLLNIVGSLSLIVLNDEDEIPFIPGNIPIILIADFGKRVSLLKKYPRIVILERPVSFEDFKLAVQKALGR